MIKVISFDFYNTLVRFWPPLDEIQQASCRELGLNLDKDKVERGYAVADAYFNEENGRKPLASLNDDERLAFFSRYEQILLENAGLPVSLDLAKDVWQLAMAVPKDFVAFEDTIPALKSLKSRGYRMGILSNLRRDMGAICKQLGIDEYLDFCINSAEAGSEKPHPPIFLAALKRVSVAPDEAVHVGDQYHSDVMGARGVGIHPVLIDRGGWQAAVEDCPKISSLGDLLSLLEGAPGSLA